MVSGAVHQSRQTEQGAFPTIFSSFCKRLLSDIGMLYSRMTGSRKRDCGSNWLLIRDARSVANYDVWIDARNYPRMMRARQVLHRLGRISTSKGSAIPKNDRMQPILHVVASGSNES